MIQTPVIVTFANQERRSRKTTPLRDLRQLSGDERCPCRCHRLRFPALHHEMPQVGHQEIRGTADALRGMGL